jgi:dUTP pyrophosphatase
LLKIELVINNTIMSTPKTKTKSTPTTPKSSKKNNTPKLMSLPKLSQIANVVTANEFNNNLDQIEDEIAVQDARITHLEHHMDTEDADYKASRPGIVNKIQIKLLNKYAKTPVYATNGDAGMDLFASETVTIVAKSQSRVVAGGIIPDSSGSLTEAPEGIPAVLNRKLVPTGVAMAIPVGYYGRIAPRSGLACKGITVDAGVIDAPYRGEIKVLIVNNSTEDKTFIRGAKFAQLILTKILDRPEFNVVEDLPNSDRGAGGFGSSGN